MTDLRNELMELAKNTTCFVHKKTGKYFFITDINITNHVTDYDCVVTLQRPTSQNSTKVIVLDCDVYDLFDLYK